MVKTVTRQKHKKQINNEWLLTSLTTSYSNSSYYHFQQKPLLDRVRGLRMEKRVFHHSLV